MPRKIKREGNHQHLFASVTTFLEHRGLFRPQVKRMAADIRHRADLVDRLPRLVAYALHHDQFFRTLKEAEELKSPEAKKVVLKGLTLYARESPWPDQVDFVARRLLGFNSPAIPQVQAVMRQAKVCTPGERRVDAQKALVRKARLTKQARPFQLAVLRGVGWKETSQWLERLPYAASKGRGQSLYSPDQIKALNLPRIDERSSPKRKKNNRLTTEKTVMSTAVPARRQEPESPPPAPAARESGGALVVFDDSIFANIKHRVETGSWRVISADTYFLAEALSVHQRWIIRFPERVRVSTSTVVDSIRIRVQEKGLVADLWLGSAIVDRINFQRSLVRSQTPIPAGPKQSVGLILLYIFNSNRKLKKSSSAEDLSLALEVSSSRFAVSSVYRVKTASTMADIGIHSRVRGNSSISESKRHDVRGHIRRVRGVDYRVKAHQRGG